MERKEMCKLTVEELEELVKEFKKIEQDGCGGIPCDKCKSSRSAWKEYASTGTPCREIRAKAIELLLEAKSGVSIEITETLETIQITPETTNLKSMVESGYIHQLAGVFKNRDAISDMCKQTDCDNCKLHQRNYSSDIPHTGCREARDYIMYVSRFLRTYGQVKPTNAKTCKNCGYYIKRGDYDFCTAWNNFTTEEMYCGYYKNP